MMGSKLSSARASCRDHDGAVCVCIPAKLNSKSDDVDRKRKRGAWWSKCSVSVHHRVSVDRVFLALGDRVYGFWLSMHYNGAATKAYRRLHDGGRSFGTSDLEVSAIRF
jgi:hypothetical protein